ncbi:hypothetical protein ACQEUU_12020 [Nonomuraea sp. CA-218870]|uniref:hypothetical protein n=1 Tax=Nonomuraea sp. CA-218870 TaxID=3239998 RepID=UPI003D8CAF32
MIRKLALIGLTAAGVALLAAAAHADTRIGNGSRNSESSQTGNNFSNIGTSNRGGAAAANVTTINGNAVVPTNRGWARVGVEVD